MTATMAPQRPTIVIQLPKLFRRQKATPVVLPVQNETTKPKGVVSLTVSSVRKAFAWVGNKLWGNRVFRYATYFVGAVAGTVALNFGIAAVSLLLATPFLLAGWLLVADTVFFVSYFLGWYVSMFLALRWIFSHIDELV